MPGVWGSPESDPKASERQVRYTAIDESLSVVERLDASLVPPDRSLFEVAIRRSFGNWVFHVPATFAVLWLSTVIPQLAIVLGALLAILILTTILPSGTTAVLAAPAVLIRPFYARGRAGYLWFLGTTTLAALDVLVCASCLFILARAADLPVRLPF